MSQGGVEIFMGGGGELCRSFLQEDLVDELYLGLGPVLLGDGIPAFPAKFPRRDFKLTECKSYSNGLVGLGTSGCGRGRADSAARMPSESKLKPGSVLSLYPSFVQA
jgi:RibD C-terminal domain